MSNRTIHDQRCEDDIHGELDYPLEACYYCESIETCMDTFETRDPLYPVICRWCKFDD